MSVATLTDATLEPGRTRKPETAVGTQVAAARLRNEGAGMSDCSFLNCRPLRHFPAPPPNSRDCSCRHLAIGRTGQN